jgi:hypothetical protein
MKSLYESILDDEDVLVKNTRKTTSNWLVGLKYMLENSYSEDDIRNFLSQDFVTRDIEPIFKDFKKAHWEIGKSNRGSYYCNLHSGTIRSIHKSSSPLGFVLDGNRMLILMTFNSLMKTVQNNVNKETLFSLGDKFKEMGAKSIVNCSMMYL